MAIHDLYVPSDLTSVAGQTRLKLAAGTGVTLVKSVEAGLPTLTLSATGGGGGTPADTVVTETSYGQASVVGVATAYSRGDHSHGSPALGTSGTTACAGNDARLSDARAPTGAAGGQLGGTYPNPDVWWHEGRLHSDAFYKEGGYGKFRRGDDDIVLAIVVESHPRE